MNPGCSIGVGARNAFWLTRTLQCGSYRFAKFMSIPVIIGKLASVWTPGEWQGAQLFDVRRRHPSGDAKTTVLELIALPQPQGHGRRCDSGILAHRLPQRRNRYSGALRGNCRRSPQRLKKGPGQHTLPFHEFSKFSAPKREAALTWRIQSVSGPRAGPVGGSGPGGPTETAGLHMREGFRGTVGKSRHGSSVLEFSRPDPLVRPTRPENPPRKHCVEPIREISARCNDARCCPF